MKKTAEIVLILLLLLCVSCERDTVKASSVVSESFVTREGREAVSLWFVLEGYTDAQRLEIRSPSDSLTWSLAVSTAEYEGRVFTGSSDAVMPLGTSLLEGQWSYTLVFKDGRTLEGVFDIN